MRLFLPVTLDVHIVGKYNIHSESENGPHNMRAWGNEREKRATGRGKRGGMGE